jgi:hypothetical protein
MKSLIVATTMVCVLLALLAEPIVEARRQQRLLDHAASLGAKINFLGSTSREASLGRFLLAIFDASYDRFRFYGLDFSASRLRDDDLEQVVEINHIKQLNLAGTQISDTALRHLDKLEFLERIDLGNTAVTDKGIARLSSRRRLASLRVVGTTVSYDALERLDAKLPHAHFCEQRAIEELKAAGIQVVDPPRWIEVPNDFGHVEAGREALAVVAGMNRKISLTAQDVARLGYLQWLREMTFHTVTLGPEGLAALRPLAKLKHLDIWFVNLSDSDLMSLARQTQLESLTIHGCDQITDAGLMQLRTLTNLKTLSINGCKGITKEGKSALARKLPDCRWY